MFTIATNDVLADTYQVKPTRAYNVAVLRSLYERKVRAMLETDPLQSRTLRREAAAALRAYLAAR